MTCSAWGGGAEVFPMRLEQTEDEWSLEVRSSPYISNTHFISDLRGASLTFRGLKPFRGWTHFEVSELDSLSRVQNTDVRGTF